MSKTLVIVESPTKAKTISKFLGKEYEITASYGHVRDLPNGAAEIPEKYKKEKWSRVGVNVDEKFSPLYIIPDAKKKRVKELKDFLKHCDRILLATDEDREGESISWHLMEVLQPKVPVQRLVFHEITKTALLQAIESPREIDENLVKAQETRRIIDRLFGYLVSPVLWKKMAPRLSAGRVQSVAIRLLVERERARMSFKKSMYWDLKAKFEKLDKSGAFEAELTHVGEKRVASGKDFNPDTGRLDDASKVLLLDAKASNALKEKIEKLSPEVLSIEEKPYSSKPYPPFTTSTLQQEASRKLRFAARHTMSVAQSLYENGFITYMRTDSTTLSQEGLNAARSLITKEFGKDFLHPEPRVYQTKVKNAQEAHEAVRPAGETFASVAEVNSKLGMEAAKLYELIWKRTIASQMKDALGTRVSVAVGVGDARFRAAGKTISFPGHLRAYVEGADDPDAELADQEVVLPPLKEGEKLRGDAYSVLEHETQAPARYTEGSLIKKLEELGIGRPSTWATIVGVVLNRSYAFKRGTALVPTFLAIGVIGLMEGYFIQLLDYDFTAKLEDDLDNIAVGQADNLKYLNKFYFGNGHAGLKELVEKGEQTIDPRLVCGIPLFKTEDGKEIEVRIGRYGPFLSDGTNRASIPDELAPDELSLEKAQDLLATAARGPESLGNDPTTGLPIYVKTGRFGPYLQLGETPEDKKEKPKMASLLPGMDAKNVSFEEAVKILELPKVLGKTDAGDDIIVSNGRYGPYVKAGSDTRTIPLDDMSPITMTLEQAKHLLAQPKTGGRGRPSKPASLREVGKHPVTEKVLVIKSGRYGPYVTDGEINASLPKGADPQNLTVEDAVGLLSARAAKIAEMGGMPVKKTRAKKAKTEKAAGKSKKSKKGEEAE